MAVRSGKAERQCQSRDPRSGAQAGSVFGGDRSQPERLPVSREGKPSGSVKRLPGKIIEILRRAACQVLLVADWAKERKPRMLPSDCFETGRRSLTQSSVERDRPTANGCLVLHIARTAAERQQPRTEGPRKTFSRAPPERVRRAFASLDKDLSWMSASRKLTAAHGLEVAFGNLEGFVTHSQNKCGEVIRSVWRRTAVRFRLIGIIHRGFGGAAYMQMTQIAQCSAVFCAHAPSKIWVPQMFIARELVHVLENAQSLLDSFLSLRRQIAPGGQHIILNVS